MNAQLRDYLASNLHAFPRCCAIMQALEDEFHGKVEQQKQIVEYMRDEHGWHNKTVATWLKRLEEFGVIRSERCPRDRWTMRYYLLEV